jgi:hypothetical protein
MLYPLFALVTGMAAYVTLVRAVCGGPAAWGWGSPAFTVAFAVLAYLDWKYD